MNVFHKAALESLKKNRTRTLITIIGVVLSAALFTGMLTLISVANVFNTITTNIRLRRRELSMLRSVGMGDAAFGRMMRLESSFYVLRTMLFAVPISGILSWGIYKVIGSVEEMESFTWHFPLGSVVISLCGVACIVFAAMAFATGQLRRENILDALRDGME